jgi:two-component system chemotaxis response regulator CheY
MRRSTPLDYPRVLIVEDDRSIRGTLAEILADEGYLVQTAENGQQALEVCRAQLAPDLILLDLQMPVMDGWEFMRVRTATYSCRAFPSA